MGLVDYLCRMKKVTKKNNNTFLFEVKKILTQNGFEPNGKFGGLDRYTNPSIPVLVLLDGEPSYGFSVFVRFTKKPSVMFDGLNPHSWKFNFLSIESCPIEASKTFAVHLQTAIKNV